jgi:UDP-glucose 4-epimerase
MRILITGGSGFIGSHLAESCLAAGLEVRILDLAKSRLCHHPNLTEIVGDVRDCDLVNRCTQEVDVVYHLAAVASVEESTRDPLGCIEKNVIGFLNVIERSISAGVPKIVLASSCAVYGGLSARGMKEDDRISPKSPYAISKLTCEQLMEFYGESAAIETVSLRFFNVYGPRQSRLSKYAAVMPIFISKALAGENLEIFGTGDQTRDFVFVKDLVNALRLVAERGTCGVYNVGSSIGTSINELAEMILETTGSSSRVFHHAPRSGEVFESSADTGRIRALGWNPRYDLRRGIGCCVEYLIDAETKDNKATLTE